EKMGEFDEVSSAPITPRPVPVAHTPPITSAPPSQFHSPSLSRSPLLHSPSSNLHPGPIVVPKTPNKSRNITPRFLTPLGSPIRKALRLTKLDPQDAWLPITESRNGNAYYAAFHTLCSGIGIQALVLPVAFAILGWAWGVITVVLAFIWQLYTLYLLVQLHESIETGMRYSRYIQLACATFGEKLGKWLALFPIMYLAGGTCCALIVIGGSTMKTFFEIICAGTCTATKLTMVEWYLVFTCGAVLLSQLPNLNSIAGVSLIGAITAVGYCTIIWVVSVTEGRVANVSYNPVRAGSQKTRVFDLLNALGIVAFAFRGHNLILEIQATMPSSEKHPSRVPMWTGVKFSYTLIAACLFPLAIGGYWAYGRAIKKPKVYSPIWWLNWVLGVLGMCLSGLLIAAGVYVIIDTEENSESSCLVNRETLSSKGKMGEVDEVSSAPITPRPASVAPKPPITSAPASQFHSPSLSRSPLLHSPSSNRPGPIVVHKTPNKSRNITPRFLTPLGSPIRKALKLTKLDPQDAWLPITESRNGNAYYAAFHTLCSGIGIQALVLPVAFAILGWAWGMITLVLAFIWQLYTLYLLVQLHESVETGMRYSRYIQLACATFGERLGKWLALFPIMYLAGGTCVALIVIGGSTMKTFFEIVCAGTCTATKLTTVEWYLVFTCGAVLLSQLPNLNSIAGVSLIGAITAVGYCTIIWVVSVTKGRVPNVSYNPVRAGTQIARAFDLLNALGIVAFAFRGHNLILEIQATMPSSEKHPSRVPMWSGVKFSYALIAACIFPLAIGGYWAYGHDIPVNGGMLAALYMFHGQDTAQWILGLTSLFIIINALSSFQIYGMPMFDDMESKYTTRFKKPCTWWLRVIIRCMFGYGCFFVAVAIPFLGSFAGLIGGIGLPVTLAYPCFMWLKIKKPKAYSSTWWLNWILGVLGMGLSGILIAAGVYVVIDTGIQSMGDVDEVSSAPITPRPASVAPTPPITSAPVSQFHSPSLSRSPLLHSPSSNRPGPIVVHKTPNKSRNITPRFLTPLGSPIRKALKLTKLDPQDAWLPITESRNGNAYYAAFHTLCSGIGIQALVLPVALAILGWAWGMITIILAFIWQLYTLYLLVQLHESVETGMRYSRYIQLACATFGEKLGKWLALFPIMYLAGGTCCALIVIGGSTMKTFFEIVCAGTCSAAKLTKVEWFLVFTCGAVLLSQLPNLNSIAGVSLVGAITAVGYCTIIWVVSVSEGRVPNVSYNPVRGVTQIARAFDLLNALGIVAFAFRGHNLILEIQATMPSSEKHPSRVPMWAGVKVSYFLIAACLFPLSIGGYWAYGRDAFTLSLTLAFKLASLSLTNRGIVSNKGARDDRNFTTPAAKSQQQYNTHTSMQDCLELGSIHHYDTELISNPQDAWLPITESRKGNSRTAAFHLVCSGIGIQVLVLPVAFAALKCLLKVLGYHMFVSGIRMATLHHMASSPSSSISPSNPLQQIPPPLSSRLWLVVVTNLTSDPWVLLDIFTNNEHLRLMMYPNDLSGGRLGKLLGLFPVVYLSGGTCVMLIITGGGTMKLFYQVVCGDEASCIGRNLNSAVWFLAFTCLAIAVALLCPNLNYLAGVSLVGAITAVGYCSLIWIFSISKGRSDDLSYSPPAVATSEMSRVCGILNALGIIALAFRGHNIVLEIQGSMPSSPQNPSYQPMWKGVIMSYLLVAMCIFPVAIGGYWAYGNKVAATGGMFIALLKFHGNTMSKFVVGLIYLLVVLNCLSTFQIYAMPVFDNLEQGYTNKKNKRCPRWLRSGFRVLFGGLAYFVSVALPFLGSLAALIGGIALPLTFSYPCFMWIAMKKPQRSSAMWFLNLGLGCLGILLSVLIVAAAVWNLVRKGLYANFFKP
ncbi:hypothetical protein RJ639_005322, partial [Escallonia herrerae]